MKIMIIGGGSTGLTLANLLTQDHDVTLVEQDEKVAKEVASNTSALVIQGEGSDITTLKEANITEMEALITTIDDKTNLMVCQIAKGENIERVISIVKEPKNEELFTKLGVNRLVSTVGNQVIAIKRLLYQVGDARVIAQMGSGDVQIVELTVAEKSKLIDQKSHLKNASIAVIYRKGELIIPDSETTIEQGDVLLIALKTKFLSAITDLIQGE
jgi:trk system potassium uptake protein